MKRIKLYLILLCASISFVSCDESSDNNNSNGNFADNFGNAVSRDFIGQVVDVNGNPVQNAAVKIGSTTEQTDVNGVFVINNANVYERFAYITAKKAGYIDGSRSMVPTSGKNNVKIMLLPSTPVATIASGATSEVDLPSGTKVTFDGSFADESGNAYSGSVSVAMYHLEASNPNIGSIMPGMLYGEDSIGEEAVLSTFGMMNVELRGSGGQKLQIAEGHTAEITMAIDPSQMATAPSTIPLWHFDEAAGYWIQEGTATKQGNMYVGDVSHFSWWNCDTFASVVSLTVSVQDSDGNPISNVGVGLTIISTNFNSSIQSTGSTGQVTGQIPGNQSLLLNLYDNCGNIVYTSTIGPFSSNTVLPTITLTSVMVTAIEVEGHLFQCDGSDVTNGYVMLIYGNQTLLSPVSNGAFSFNTLVCDSNIGFTVTGYDYDNLQSTGEIAYTFTDPVTNIGSITTCNTITEFITYQIDSDPVVNFLLNINANGGGQGQPNGFSINAYTANQQEQIFIFGNISGPGIYSTSEFTIKGSNLLIYSGTLNDVVFNVSAVGAVGEYIDMTFNGTYQDSFNVTHTISGTAHVIRDN